MNYLIKNLNFKELYTKLASVMDEKTNIKFYFYSIPWLLEGEKIPYTNYFPLKLLKANEIEIEKYIFPNFIVEKLDAYCLIEIKEEKETPLKLKSIYDLSFNQFYNLFFEIYSELEYSIYSNNTRFSNLSNEYLIKNEVGRNYLIGKIKYWIGELEKLDKYGEKYIKIKRKNIYIEIVDFIKKNLKEENTLFDKKIKLEVGKLIKLLKIDSLDIEEKVIAYVLTIYEDVLKNLKKIDQILEVLNNYTEEEILTFLNINIFLWKPVYKITEEDIKYILSINYRELYEKLNLDDKFTFKYSLVLKVIYEKTFEYLQHNGEIEILKETLNSDLQKEIKHFLKDIQIKNLYLDYYKIFVKFEKKLKYSCLANNRDYYFSNYRTGAGILPAVNSSEKSSRIYKIIELTKNISNFCMGNKLRLNLFYYYLLIELAKMYDLNLKGNDKKVLTGNRSITDNFKEEFLSKLQADENIERKLEIHKIYQNFNNYSFFLRNLFEEKKSLEIDHQYFLEVGLKVKKQFKIKNIPGIITNFSFFHKEPETSLYPDANYVVKTIETGELNIYEYLFCKDNFYYFKDVGRKDILKFHKKDIEVYLLKSLEIDTNQMKYC